VFPRRRPIQGLPKDEKNSFGRVPVPVSVELCEDLVGRLAPGDVATIVGIVRVYSGDSGGAGGWLQGAASCVCVPSHRPTGACL
jgi:DNA replicative helicase MCM subunit Mcm2 (Cdc46/Mcm family)